MSTRSSGRHRSDAAASTPLTTLAGSVTEGLQTAATGSRNGVLLALTTGLVATMGVPAAHAALRGGADRSSTASVALTQDIPADVLTAPVTATRSAQVRFERAALTAARPSARAGTDAGTVRAADDVARTSRALTRAAYQQQQQAQPRTTPATGSTGGSTPSGVSGAACGISPSIETHLMANARAVYRAVCAAFGDVVSAFGGYRPGDSGDHGSGRAVDIMVSGDPGWAVARYVQAHAAELHVTYVIYQQQIWLAGRPTNQWRRMEDRGSITANHFDHVHVSVS
ncbi:MAG TPA: hypothetical protein VE781_08105 [Kineosporiaceae bacterium]|nr:hypothetical protein [Kineosporiaceae bacterium]